MVPYEQIASRLTNWCRVVVLLFIFQFLTTIPDVLTYFQARAAARRGAPPVPSSIESRLIWRCVGLVLCLGALTVVEMRRFKIARILDGCCPKCGYDLRATPEKGKALLDRCPECGTEATKT